MIKLDNFKIDKQKTSYTCAYATVSMVTSFFGTKVDEEALLSEFPLGYLGATPAKVIKAFNKYLPGFTIAYAVKRKKDLLNFIEVTLKEGIPIPFICLTEDYFNKPNLTSHYSVIIGIDTDNNTLIIANPFGYKQTEDIDVILKSMAFRTKGPMPFVLKLAIFLRVLRGYMVFELRRTRNNE